MTKTELQRILSVDPEGRDRPYPLYLPPELAADIKIVAKRLGLTPSQFLRKCVDRLNGSDA